MALCINQSGTYRNITTLCINQSGTYRNITTGCINQSGTYRLFGFLPQPGALGSSFGGGFLICKPGLSPAWVVSPYSAEVSRSWYSRNDANTSAQAVSGCTGWFVPTCAQLQNPGYVCRTYWDSYSSGNYWSSTFGGHHTYSQFTGMDPPGQDVARTLGRFVNFTSGTTATTFGSTVCCIRAFRCVSY